MNAACGGVGGLIDMTGQIKTKRVYLSPSPSDGCRVLVDRLWPRGLTKDRAVVDYWLADLAPSSALRRWFAHDPAKWTVFRQRYCAELATNEAAFTRLRGLLNTEKTVTLLFAAKNESRNNAIVPADYLRSL